MPDQVQNKKLRQFTLLRIIWRCHHVAWYHAPYEKQYESHWYAGLLREKRKGHAHVSAAMQRDHEIRPLRTEESAKEVAAALVTPYPTISTVRMMSGPLHMTVNSVFLKRLELPFPFISKKPLNFNM